MKPSFSYCYWTVMMWIVCLFNVQAQTDVQVDPNTGKALISLPIWKLNAGNLSVPVTVSYNGGGIRPDDGEGSAGMGWDLNAGGSVVRDLKGLPDDYNQTNDTRKGWLFTSNAQSILNFNPDDNGCSSWSSFSPFTAINDTEPDVFSFNAPGLNGKFVFDNSGTLRLMPFQDVKITYTTDARGIYSFKITTNQGVAYTFSQRSLTNRKATQTVANPVQQFSRDFAMYSQVCTYGSAWYLTSIKGAYGEKINFGYIYNATDKNNEQKSIYINGAPNVRYTMENITNRPILNYIMGMDYNVYFTYEGNDKPISKIEVRVVDGGFASHSFNFSYDVLGTGVFNTNRHFLNRITEESNCKSFPAYRFTYHNTDQVAFGSRVSRDLFGYFNGGEDVTDLPMPPVYRNDGADNGERFRFYPNSGYITLSSGTGRSVNPDWVYNGSLKRIIYPTSGYSEIAYQSNEYYDEATGTTLPAAGVRVSSVTVSDGDSDVTNNIIRNYEYKNEDGSSSGRWLYTPAFAFADGTGVVTSPSNLAPDQTILYQRATVYLPGNGKTVYQYNIPGHYPQLTVSDWSATRSRIVSQSSGSCPSPGNLLVGSYTYPFAPNTNYEFQQGQIADIFHYAQSGKLVREQHYTYTRLSPEFATVKGLRIQPANLTSTTYVFGLYSYVLNASNAIQNQTDIYYDAGSSSLAQTTVSNYMYNNHQMLSETNTTGSDGQILKTKFTYAKDLYTTTPSGNEALMIKMLCDSLRHGTIIESNSQAGSVIVGSSLTLFTNFGTGYSYPYQQLSYRGNGTLQNASLSGGSVVYDYNQYYNTQTTESFNIIGRPQTTIGIDRGSASVLYGKDKATPLASVGNARPNEVVFSDFENGESYQLATSNTGSAWTGVGGYQLNSGASLSKNVQKSAAALRYRIRCRAFANTSSDITLTLQPGNVNLVYSGTRSGKWILLDKMVDVSSVSSPFLFQITANATIVLDDIAFYPEHASIQSTTLIPFAGKSSETDNRGYTTFYEYDALGRLAYVKDTDLNILQAHDYFYQSDPIMGPISAFSPAGGDYIIGSNVTFNNVDNCDNTIQYSWLVNGVEQSTESTFSYTFSQLGDYELQLIVRNSKGESSSSFQTFHIVNPPVPPLYLTATGDNSDLTCDSRIRSFSVSIAGGCYDASTVTCTWYFSKDNGTEIILQTGQGISSLDNFDLFSGGNVTERVMIRCEVQSRCTDNWDTINTTEAVFQMIRTDSTLPCVN